MAEGGQKKEMVKEAASKVEMVHISFCNNKSELTNHLYSYINSLIFEYQGEVVQTFATSGWKRLGNHTNVYVTADGAVGHPEWKILSDDGFLMKDIYSGTLYAEIIPYMAELGLQASIFIPPVQNHLLQGRL